MKKSFRNCDERKGTLAISVKARITFASHLHTADAVCHAGCNSSFRTRKDLPKTYTGNKTSTSPGLGRPLSSDSESAFHQMIEYSCSNDLRQITLNEQKELMDPFLKDSSYKAFTTKCGKQILLKNLKDEDIQSKLMFNQMYSTLEQIKPYCKTFITKKVVVINRIKKE